MTNITINTPKDQHLDKKVDVIKNLFNLNPSEVKLLKKLFVEFETRQIFFLGKHLRVQIAKNFGITDYYFSRTIGSLVKKGILIMLSYKHYKLNPTHFPEKQVINFQDQKINFEIGKEA